MDTRTREEITAATAVHRELGPVYEDAVAESLVERIGAEVDKRVDARLAQRGGPPPAPAPRRAPAAQQSQVRSQWPPVVLALGSMLAGLLATLAAMHNQANKPGPVFVSIALWIAIAAVNIGYARHR
jgi:hypothetical protein